MDGQPTEFFRIWRVRARSSSKPLAAAQRKLDDEAGATRDSSERARLAAQSQGIASARATTKAAAAASPAVQMNEAKKLNQSGMSGTEF